MFSALFPPDSDLAANTGQPGATKHAPVKSKATRRVAQVLWIWPGKKKTMITTAVDRTKMHDYRPLLMSDDRYERMRELLKEREPFYTMADEVIDNASRPLDDVIEEAVVLARQQAGW